MLTLSVVMSVIVIGTIAPTSTVSASTNSISKIQSGLVSSDSLTTGNTAGWTFGGTATLYNYYEDSQGLHLGVQAPSSGRWVNYYAASSGANAHLFHAALTIPYTSVPDGVFNPGLYVEGSNYNGIVGCQAYADNTGYYWTVQSSTDAGSTWTTLYAPPANSLPQTDDCTVMTDGNHYLKVYIGGNVVFSSTTVNLNMPTPLHAFVQVDSSSSSMDHAIYSNYYSTTDENIKITNNPSNAAMVKVIGTAGNVLATAPVSAGTAILNVGMYKFPLSGTIDVYDSNNSIIASSPASIYGGDVYSVSSSSGTLTVPQSPTSLTATTISSSQINLSWTAPSNNGGSAITGYKIERSTDSGITWSTVVANTASVSTTYSDSGLAASTAYTYRVSAINSVGTGSPSNTASATTQNAPVSVPQSPTNLTASAISSSQINLSWTAPSNNGGSAITGYKIERSTDSGITWSTVVANTASVSTTYSDTGLAPNTAYTYRVSAINSVGTGSPSNTASATTSSSTTTGSIILNSVKTTSGTVSSLPYQITLSNVNVGTGTNRLLVVGVTANNQFVTSVTFGGTQLTKAVRSFHNDYTGFWYLTNPSGTGNIVVTMDGSTSVVVGAYSFSGVDQTTPIPTNITNYDAAASSPTISITTQYPNSWVLDLPAIYGGVTLGSPTCTQQWNINMPSAITGASSSSVKTSAGLTTCGWTASGSGDLWDDAAIEIKASGTVITTNPQSLTLIKSGLLLSDSLTNETKTQQQLQTNPGYWRYGGDAQAEKAHYTFWKDTQGLHIGVQAPSNATWAGIYALSRNTQAMLYHSIITTPVQTIPANNVYYNNGIYVQTNGTSNVNYVACSSNVSSFGTVWAVFWATGNPFSATNFTRLWYDPNPNQPLTRDCTIITNGNNYLRVYVDGVKVVDRTDMNLQMPPPFNVFLEPQSSYAGQMLNGTFTDYYTLAGENVTVNNLPQNAARVDITDSSGKILATSQIVNHIARLDVGQYHFPLSGTIKVYDSGNIMIASDSSNIYGGDVYSVNH
ncbi:exported protein of unknown function [Candidatus Nitrosotalea okcheonensis]|uniref:Fibronectin type-III domain-containing protein n=2 Tax=Candidatus Nitrosotalea okcheonensis TaxID=1903276 RepID=A0A2H1FFA5_9ARCH|nr:exported protein of unknown function [Candidatus Nitrosotalea okcheonensis]